jgi:hypothetical protein
VESLFVLVDRGHGTFTVEYAPLLRRGSRQDRSVAMRIASQTLGGSGTGLMIPRGEWPHGMEDRLPTACQGRGWCLIVGQVATRVPWDIDAWTRTPTVFQISRG